MHNSDSKSSIVWVYHRHKKSYNFFGMNLKATTETSNSFDLMSSFVGAWISALLSEKATFPVCCNFKKKAREEILDRGVFLDYNP